MNADGIQFQQMLLSLVRNAIEALSESPPAGRKVTLQTARLPDGQIELNVCDNGPGVAAGVADRLFIPFATTKATGTGLGLAISRTIVQAHGGTIGHRSRAPTGSCFYVRIPPAADPP